MKDRRSVSSVMSSVEGLARFAAYIRRIEVPSSIVNPGCRWNYTDIEIQQSISLPTYPPTRPKPVSVSRETAKWDSVELDFNKTQFIGEWFIAYSWDQRQSQTQFLLSLVVDPPEHYKVREFRGFSLQPAESGNGSCL